MKPHHSELCALCQKHRVKLVAVLHAGVYFDLCKLCYRQLIRQGRHRPDAQGQLRMPFVSN